MATPSNASGDHISLGAILDQLNNAEARALLDTVDSMRELQLNEMVDLPQIIVVGDQSSGKSSVLEAISRVRFPVKSNVCTRFATELVMRRAAKSSIDVSIKFSSVAGGSSSGQQQETQAWQRNGFANDTLPEVIREAEEKMGLSGENAKGFSKDILRVEVSGPDVYPLTLVDLPGFYHNATEHQTKEGIRIVEQLAESYMRQRNSIIMVVISANSQLASHKVLEEAKRHDPARERTLGVVTKPDLAEPGDEKQCLRLVRGEEQLHHLSLGWHVLRNRSRAEQDAAAEDRDTTEQNFFQSSAWSCIPAAHRGAQELRKRLSKVLLEHIQKSLPRLIAEMDSKLETKQHQLEGLGKPRSTAEDLRSYLIDIADNVRRLAQDAVSGRYHDTFFGSLEDDELKLRAQLRSLNRAFCLTLETKGASRKIRRDDDDLDNGDDDDEESHVSSSDSMVVPEYLEPFLDLYKFPDPEPMLESDLQAWLERLASTNQGKEFPDIPNADLVVQVFKSQAEPWRGIAEYHVKVATSFAKAFVDRLIGHVVGTSDKRTSAAILRGIVDPFFDERRDVLTSKLDELLLPYSAGFALPLDSEFRSRLARRTVRRLTDKFADLMASELDAAAAATPKKQKPGPSAKSSRHRIRQLILEAEDTERGGGSDFGTEKIIDMVNTAYEMALRSFMDNVVNLAVESCLTRVVPDILTPKMVNSMSEVRLRELAQESPEVQVERNTLAREVEKLRQGLGQCRLHRPRELTVLPSNFARRSSTRFSSPSGAANPSPAVQPAPVAAMPATLSVPAAHPVPQSTPKTSLFASPASSLPSNFTSLATQPAATTPQPLFVTPAAPPKSGLLFAGASTSPHPFFTPSEPSKQSTNSAKPSVSPSTGFFGGAAKPSVPPSTGIFGGVVFPANKDTTSSNGSFWGHSSATVNGTPE